MRYFFFSIFSELTVRLRSIKSWLITLLLPAMILAAGQMLPAEEISAPVQVGVAIPEEGAEGLWALLDARSNDVVEFCLTDADTIDRNVAAGRWDCGLVVAEDFADRVKQLDLDRVITIRIGLGSAVYPLVRETVSACMAQLIGPDIAMEYLLESGIVTEQTASQAEPFLKDDLDETERVNVRMSTPDGEPLSALELAQEGMDAILCWMVSAVILVRMLLGATDLGKWIRSAPIRRMKSLRTNACLMAARIGADGLLMFLSGSVALLLLGKGIFGCMAVMGYVLFWMVIAILLAHFPSISGGLPVFMPFAVVLSLLLSSVLVDISLIVPVFSGVSGWFPDALFLRGCEGDLGPVLCLFGTAGIMAAVGFPLSSKLTK